MVLVPAGECLVGQWRQKEHLPAFYITKTPITNAQYGHFVKAGGKRPPHWKGKIPRGKKDHPVVYVSWDDAAAYCSWLSTATGKTFRLPTEREWEKAARGSDGREYPWGNRWQEGRCNTDGAHVWDTTPVGTYSPLGDSPYGCVDMAGNVWEWTGSWYDSAREGRVLRGGSWDRYQSYARCAYRLMLPPGDRHKDVGFRCVCPISVPDLVDHC
jgi:formylglycine-generating enzyme required for sulfatase activity